MSGKAAPADTRFERWKPVPLSHGQVWASESSSRAVRLGLTLTSPCNSRLLAAHDVILKLPSRAWGVRAKFRSGSSSTSPSVDDSLLAAVLTDIEQRFGFVEVAALGAPRQGGRGHFVLLATAGSMTYFVKATTSAEASRRDAEVYRALSGGIDSLRVPQFVGEGEALGLSWVITEAVQPGRHRPVWNYPAREMDELVGRLAGVVELGPSQTVSHNDLAPWNLREVGDQRWVIDWSDTGGAAKGFDHAYFEAAAVALGGLPAMSQHAEPAMSEVRALVEGRVEREPSVLNLAMAALIS